MAERYNSLIATMSIFVEGRGATISEGFSLYLTDEGVEDEEWELLLDGIAVSLDKRRLSSITIDSAHKKDTIRVLYAYGMLLRLQDVAEPPTKVVLGETSDKFTSAISQAIRHACPKLQQLVVGGMGGSISGTPMRGVVVSKDVLEMSSSFFNPLTSLRSFTKVTTLGTHIPPL